MPTRSAGDLPLATYCFLRSFENREIRWPSPPARPARWPMRANTIRVSDGSFFVAALCHPQRGLISVSWALGFRDRHVIAAGAASALADETGAPPFAYALAQHTASLRPFVDRSTSFHSLAFNDTCDSDCELGF